MAVSYEQWPPAAESIQAYYTSIDMGPSYGAAYNVPATSEYGAQQLSVFGDAISQTYVRRVPPRQLFLRPSVLSADARRPRRFFVQECRRADPSMSSPWSLMGPGQSGQVFFGSPIDMAKLEEARMLLSGMDYGRATGQDEDGDTWVLLCVDERTARVLIIPVKIVNTANFHFQ